MSHVRTQIRTDVVSRLSAELTCLPACAETGWTWARRTFSEIRFMCLV